MSTATDLVKAAAPSVSLTPMLPGEQYALAAAAFFKALDDLMLILNSPQMLAARKAYDLQQLANEQDATLREAQKTGNIEQLDQEDSG